MFLYVHFHRHDGFSLSGLNFLAHRRSKRVESWRFVKFKLEKNLIFVTDKSSHVQSENWSALKVYWKFYVLALKSRVNSNRFDSNKSDSMPFDCAPKNCDGRIYFLILNCCLYLFPGTRLAWFFLRERSIRMQSVRCKGGENDEYRTLGKTTVIGK